METVGGYRLVRKLGDGERAEIFLGHSTVQTLDSKAPAEQVSSSEAAVVKVYRPSTPMASIDREIEALARVESRHILSIRDVATADDGRPCLILPRLGSASLGHLLAIRSSIGAGEAATVLVPLIGVLRLLHSSGVAHGALRLEAVLFDEAGAPVLARFGKAELIAGGGPVVAARLDNDPSVLEDRASLRCIVASVLARIDSAEQSSALTETRRWLALELPEAGSGGTGGSFTHDDLDRLGALIFDFAMPRPVLFSDPVAACQGGGAAMDCSAGSVLTGESPMLRPRGKRLGDASALPATVNTATVLPASQILAALHLPAWLEAALHGAVKCDPLSAVRKRLIAILAPVRRSVWIVGGAGLGAIIVAFAAIPATESRPTQTPTPEHTIIAEYPAPKVESPGESTRSSTPTSAPSIPPSDARLAAVSSDDPLAAAIALISLRNECLKRHSTPCLSSVDQAGSILLESDTHLIGRLSAGAALSRESSLEGFEVSLVQQLGNTAILTLALASPSATATQDTAQKNPVPLLLVRSETGWRIRDVDFG